MEKLKNVFLIFLLAIGLLLDTKTFAQVLPATPSTLEITEIMYDVEGTDTGREWIEIHNIGSAAIDLMTWKLFEANVAHKISGDVATIPAGGFAIVADVPDKFLADHAGFSGTLFDSVFSLTNTGESIALRSPEGSDVDKVSYNPELGAKGDGFSIQKTTDGRWIVSGPTPGSITTSSESQIIVAETDTNTVAIVNDTAENNVVTSTYSTHDSQAVENTKSDVVELEVTSGRPRIGFVGSPMEFVAKVKQFKNSTSSIDHRWSFGDGESKYGTGVSHIYNFPGDYIVILNSSSRNTQAVSKVLVKVLVPQISISSVGSDYIELFNSSDYESNIGGMILQTAKSRNVIAKDTLIAPHTSIRISTVQSRLIPVEKFVLIASPLGKVIDSRSITEATITLPDGIDMDILRRRLETALTNSKMI